MDLIIAVSIVLGLLFAISGWEKLSSKKFARERIICFFLGHKIEKKELVQEMGALFRGSICKRCRRFRFGKFVFNFWDESQTVKKDGAIFLSGLNPRVEAEGWKIIGDYSQLMEVSEILCAKEKKKKAKVITT